MSGRCVGEWRGARRPDAAVSITGHTHICRRSYIRMVRASSGFVPPLPLPPAVRHHVYRRSVPPHTTPQPLPTTATGRRSVPPPRDPRLPPNTLYTTLHYTAVNSFSSHYFFFFMNTVTSFCTYCRSVSFVFFFFLVHFIFFPLVFMRTIRRRRHRS